MAGILAAVLVTGLLIRIPEKSSPDPPAQLVRSSGEAIEFLKSKGEGLGYENALSELTEIHSVTVSGDSYYRLQQNYRGIPVYGRTVVYAADENGSQLLVTQNIQDIPSGLDLNPTARLEDMQYALLEYLAAQNPDSFWAEAYDNEDMSVIPDISCDPEALCIYTLDGSARLAYEICVDGQDVLFDAHNGEVLQASPMIRSATATFGFSNDMLEVPQLPSGEYILKDETNGIYVYSAEGKTYWDQMTGKVNPNVLKLVMSQDSQFGENVTRIDRDDSVDCQSMIRAKESLDCVRDVHEYFSGLMNGPQCEKLVLIYDDRIGNQNGHNAGGWYPTAKQAIGSGLFDSSDPDERVASIILGTYYSEHVDRYADIVAHEYTHFVTSKYVGWTKSNKNNEALNEAFSDIFAELFQASSVGTDPDWEVSSRPIHDPSKRYYPEKLGDRVPATTDYAHGASTVISHVAYKMWSGLPDEQNTSLSTEELALLWYRAMLMMPSDADFVDCRYVVEVAADAIGLTDDQKRCISNAFEEAGIRAVSDDVNVDFQVQEVFIADIWDADNARCTDCEVIVRKAGAAYGPCLPTDEPIVWNSSDSERCYMKLAPGFYAFTVVVHGEPQTTETYMLQVMSDPSAVKEINLYMNQGQSMLDIVVRGNADGEEVSVPGAAIEVYCDDSNELVYLGGVRENDAGLRFYLPPGEYTVIATAQGYTPAQAEIAMWDTAVRYNHSFLLETAVEDGSDEWPSAPTQISGSAPYEILTWERSYSGQTDGVDWSNRHSYDYIVLQGDDPAYEVINRDLYSLAAETMDWIRDDHLFEPQHTYEGIVENYEKVYTDPRVVHNGNGIISILLNPGQSVTYSLYNGAQVGLHTLAGDHGEVYLQRIKQAAFGDNLQNSYVQDVSTLSLDDFAFVVMDGEIVLLGVGSPGRTTFTRFSRMIHTGLYVSTEYTDRLNGTMRAKGGTGSADYEIQVWDRSFRRIGAPACLQTMEYSCEYPVFSGAPACGRINQEVYALAEEFMTGIPDDLTRTSNKFEFFVVCNLNCENENVSYKHREYAGVQYNDNGILSYVMNWRMRLTHYKNGQSPIGEERYDGLHGIVFDLDTGEHLTLQQITGMDEQTQLLMLKDAYARIYNHYTLGTRKLDYDPAEFSLTDPRFLVAWDGEIILLFSAEEQFPQDLLEVWPKTANIYEVSLPTGLYVLDSGNTDS